MTATTQPDTVTRRDAIRIFVGGGIMVTAAPMIQAQHLAQSPKTTPDTRTIRDLFGGGIGPMVTLHSDNSVTIQAPVPDMGTGVETALPMVLAEEMDVDWNSVSVERLPASLVPTGEGDLIQNYVHQGSGGSASVRTTWPQLRKCGVLTRRLILKAASSKLAVPFESLSTDKGHVIAAGQRYPYADFIDAALMQSAGMVKQAVVPVASGHELPAFEIDLQGDFWTVKDKDAYAVVGKPLRSPRLDMLLTGQETYGIDHSFPGQLYASIERCPYIDGDLRSFDAAQAKAVQGVVDVIPVPSLAPDDSQYKFNAPGVAVIATSYWAAYRARQMLEIQWDSGPQTHENNAWHRENSIQAFAKPEKRIHFTSGDVHTALEDADTVIESLYDAPHFAHLTMEPMNCTAWMKDDSCIIGAGYQYPGLLVSYIRDTFGIPAENITHLPCKLGCGFGRRAVEDYIAEACYLSKVTQKPIKLVWTREDDMQHDFFNPMSVTRFRGGLDKQGNIVAWDCLFASQGNTRMDAFPTRLIPNMHIASTRNDSRVPLGAWRGPGHNLAGFYVEGFLNELAAHTGKDPYALRMELLGADRDLPYEGWYPNKEGRGISTARNKAVLKTVAEKAAWQGGSREKGKGRGIASHFTFGSFAAMVVDVTVDDTDGSFRIDRVTAAIDCGLVVNPSGARAQIESGIIDGLSAVMHQDIQIDGGQVISRNFDDIHMARIADSPALIDISFVNEDGEPFGTGEIALPAFIPALIAALYDATGVRIRSLPIGNQLRKASA